MEGILGMTLAMTPMILGAETPMEGTKPRVMVGTQGVSALYVHSLRLHRQSLHTSIQPRYFGNPSASDERGPCLAPVGLL